MTSPILALLAFSITIFFAGPIAAAPQVPDAANAIPLEPGKPGQIAPTSAQPTRYAFHLAQGQYASIVADCRDGATTITLRDPTGSAINQHESNETATLQAPMEVAAEAAGAYRIDVAFKPNSPSAVCTVLLTPPRQASEKELSLHQARTDFFKAMLLNADGKFDDAAPFSQRALALREKALGLDDPAIAGSCWQLAEILYAKGDYPASVSFFLRALDIFEKAQGPDSRSVIALVNNLGNVYQKSGELDKAEALFRRAIAARERLNLPNDSLLAAVLHDLAVVLYEKADYNAAQKLYERSLAILEKVHGPDHAELADALENLSTISLMRGDYVDSQRLATRALRIYEESFGAGDYRSGYALLSLANSSYELGDLESAESLSRRAIAAFEKTLGREHPDVADAINTLAEVYHERKEFAKAETLYLEAFAIRQKKLGEIHADVGQSLSNLGNLYRDQGQFARAESWYERALAVREKALGTEHPDFVESLTDLSILQMAEGRFAQAQSSLSRAIAISERNADLNLRAGSERQQLAYMKLLSSQLDAAVTLNALLAPDQPAARDLALATVLERKGRVLELLADNLKSLRQRVDSGDAKLLDDLDSANAQLARLVLGGPQPHQTIEAHEARLVSLREDRDRLEATISARSAEFRAASQPVSFDLVRAALPQDSTLLEFVAYRHFRPNEPTEKGRLGERRYVVYVIRRAGDPQWKDLGEAQSLDKLIDLCRQAFRDPNRQDARRLSHALYDQLFEPIRDLLGDASRLLISPDGQLNFLPFESLLDQQDRYLVERYSISYLTAGRDLLRMRAPRESKSGPVLIADPAFGVPGGSLVAQANFSSSKPAGGARRSVTTANDLSSVYFAPLAGTAQEARVIHTLFPEATMLTGTQATKAALKRLEAPSLLHIATHGFFLRDVQDTFANSPPGGTRSAQATAAVDNSLLRSGLAFTGANLGKSANEGILTALEATGLNLWGTKLVTLSACDTGVGEVKTGEGVFGLRRAFFLAGAESLVMSLWPVSDVVTREMMTSYYSGLRQGLGRGEALRQAELAMLKRPTRRHPFYWASFIQSGDWSPLSSQR